MEQEFPEELKLTCSSHVVELACQWVVKGSENKTNKKSNSQADNLVDKQTLMDFLD